MNMSAICLFVLALTLSTSARGEFKAGFAERDISPSVGMEEPGGYGKSFHRSFHDPCKARIAVFESAGKTAVLVGLDTLMVPRKLVQQIRQDVEQKCAIPGNAILIGASHSHSSGPLGMVQP